MPLVRSWWLGKKKGKEAYVMPAVESGRAVFKIGHSLTGAPSKGSDGTVSRTGAVCVGCGDTVPLAYIRTEGKASRIGAQLMAVAAEGDRRRVYLPPSDEHALAADVPCPVDVPESSLPEQALGFRVQGYGMTRHADLFTNRQLTALTTFSDLVQEAREQVIADALARGMALGEPLESGGNGARAYADSVATYLALAVSRLSSTNSALCRWRPDPGKESVNDTFSRQALSMVWDFAEGRPFTEGPCSLLWSVGWVGRVLDALVPARMPSSAIQRSASTAGLSPSLVSTGPPYYDNVGYADLSERVVREAMSDADLVVRKRPWWSGYADVSGGARVNSPASGSVRIWRATRRLSLARSPSVSLAVVPVPRAWQMSLARIGAVAA